MIAIIDFGMGNLRSVQKAFEYVDHGAIITENPEDSKQATHLVLPGDAAFGDAIRNLRKAGWDSAIHDFVATGKPFLGICVGLQLMVAESEELGQHTGLSLIPGSCVRFPTSERVPQIGWNQISMQRESPLLEEVEEGSFFYFVHSYYVRADEVSDSVALTDYGIDYTSIAARDNMYGVQFHPEKSQKVGLRLLANFASLN
ncbi:MAG: imidazole glycerol phosphate synthase subunit HisH [Candidatus Latescibacterota bacterium]|nr:imidazole glycerol phosphate synthase subunit HisH [Candidatus Latescibacterota bacterium]